MSNSSDETLRNQRIKLILSIGLAGVCLFGLVKYIFNNFRSPTSYELFDHKVDLPVDEFKSKEVWMDRLEAQVTFLTQKQKYYEDTLLEYKEKEKSDADEKNELKRNLSLLRKEIAESSDRFDEVQKLKTSNDSKNSDFVQGKFIGSQESLNQDEQLAFIPERKAQPLISNDPFTSANPYRSSTGNYEKQEDSEVGLILRPPICEFCANREEKNEVFSIGNRTPANLSVKAILISSVDAVCRLDAQSDPIPVKLRLLGDGHLPGGVTVKLKGCLIGASAYGDISSERVYMRLENLTKVNPNGLAIETEVTGYISGEDGRFGMRGVVVDRSAKILKPALGSGILSGISQTLQSACTRPSKENVSTYTVGADFANNAASGTSDAFDMLASYYIKRAEQVQPVLQIDAGRIVDVTFTTGFSMGDIHAKENLKKVREVSRGIR